MSSVSFSILFLLLTQSFFIETISARPFPLAVFLSPLFALLTLRATSSSILLSLSPIVLLLFHMVLGVIPFFIPDPSYIVFSLSLLFCISLSKFYKSISIIPFIRQLRFYLVIASLLYVFLSFFIPDISPFIPSDTSPIGFRAKLFFIEPSHLALFFTPLCLTSFSYSSFILAIFIFFSFSQTAILILFIFSLFALFSKYKPIILGENRIAIFILLLFTSFVFILSSIPLVADPTSYLFSSGTVRLVGITLFFQEPFSFFYFIFGNGLSASDLALQDFFSSIQSDYPNTFLFGSVYDLGLLFISLLVFLLYKYLSVPLLIFGASFLLVFFNLPITQPLSYLYLVSTCYCLDSYCSSNPRSSP